MLINWFPRTKCIRIFCWKKLLLCIAFFLAFIFCSSFNLTNYDGIKKKFIVYYVNDTNGWADRLKGMYSDLPEKKAPSDSLRSFGSKKIPRMFDLECEF